MKGPRPKWGERCPSEIKNKGYSSSYRNRLSGGQSEASSWGWYTEPSCQNFYYLLLATLQWKSYHSNGHRRRQWQQHHFLQPSSTTGTAQTASSQVPLFWDKTLWVRPQGVRTQGSMFWRHFFDLLYLCSRNTDFSIFLPFQFSTIHHLLFGSAGRGISFCSDSVLIFRHDSLFFWLVILNCTNLPLVFHCQSYILSEDMQKKSLEGFDRMENDLFIHTANKGTHGQWSNMRQSTVETQSCLTSSWGLAHVMLCSYIFGDLLDCLYLQAVMLLVIDIWPT